MGLIQWSLRFCILNNLPGDVDVAGPWVTLEYQEARTLAKRISCFTFSIYTDL